MFFVRFCTKLLNILLLLCKDFMCNNNILSDWNSFFVLSISNNYVERGCRILHLDFKCHKIVCINWPKNAASHNIAVKRHCFLPVDIEIFSSHTSVTTNFPSPDIRTVWILLNCVILWIHATVVMVKTSQILVCLFV